MRLICHQGCFYRPDVIGIQLIHFIHISWIRLNIVDSAQNRFFLPDVIWIHPELCHIVCDLLLHQGDVLLRRHIVCVGDQGHLPILILKTRFALSEVKLGGG